jgi:ribose/xylose/arabinose/galactoside ABC-type transport system permease subunit
MGLICALVFIGGTFSIGLQWPTIAAEGSDSFDAISRSISYISSRPWRYLFYTAFSAVYGCLTFVFVKFLTFLTLLITHTGIAAFWTVFTLGMGGPGNKIVRLWAEPTPANPWPVTSGATQFGAGTLAQHLFEFWLWIVMALLAAFLISFFFTSQTIIYFLMRKVVDATDVEEVYMGEADEDLPLERKVEAPEIVKADEGKAGEAPKA